FNFGFFAMFAAMARVLDELGLAPVLWLRLLTLACVLTGAGVLTRWLSVQLSAMPNRRQRAVVAASMAAGLLLGPLVGWWARTARPDAWTMVFELCGLLAAIEAARGQWAGGFAAATVLFAAAVSFKQTELAGAVAVFTAWFIGGHRREAFAGMAALAVVA